MATCLIYDERRSYRDQLMHLVAGSTPGQRVQAVPTAADLLAYYARHPADVVLIGSQRALRTATEATHQLLGAHPRAAVIVIGARGDEATARCAMADGARGFLLWEDVFAPPGSTRGAQAEVLFGVLTACVAAVAGPSGVLSTPQLSSPRPGDAVSLTAREIQVLTGMSHGRSNNQIGTELYLAEDTVKTHARRLFRKLGVADRAQAVAHGFRLGLLH